RALDLHQLVLLAAPAEDPEHGVLQLALTLEVAVLARQVARVGLLDHPMQRPGDGTAPRRHGHGRERRAALGLDQHAVAALELEAAGVEVVDLARRPEADSHDHVLAAYRVLVV